MIGEILKFLGAFFIGLLGLGFILDLWYDESDKPEFVKGTKKSVSNTFEGFRKKVKGEDKDDGLEEVALENGVIVKLPKKVVEEMKAQVTAANSLKLAPKP